MEQTHVLFLAGTYLPFDDSIILNQVPKKTTNRFTSENKIGGLWYLTESHLRVRELRDRVD